MLHVYIIIHVHVLLHVYSVYSTCTCILTVMHVHVLYHICMCVWSYRFCRGCAIPCNTDPIGTDEPHYLAIDWEDSFLHLKYQGVLERVSNTICPNSILTRRM